MNINSGQASHPDFPCTYKKCRSRLLAQWLSRASLCDQNVVHSIPGRVMPKTLKMVLVALSLEAQRKELSRTRNQNWSAQCQCNVTGWNIMSIVWGVIFQ